MLNTSLQNNFIIGMDIGGTNCRIAVVNKKLSIENLKVIDSRKIFCSEDSPNNLVEVINNYIINELNSIKPNLIAIGFPSVVDKDRKRLTSTTNLKGLTNIDIVSLIENKLDIKTIIEHDAYYLLAYDIKKYKLKNEGIIIGCYFGTGYGNAMYINGKPYIGNNGMASETGHIPIEIVGKKCTCGNSGCIESYCCGLALENIINDYYKNEDIKTIFKFHADDEPLDNFIHYMSMSIATLINILDPAAIFIGGGIIYMDNFPKEKLLKYVLDKTRKTTIKREIQIIFSTNDSNQNGIIGAAISGFKYLENIKTN